MTEESIKEQIKPWLHLNFHNNEITFSYSKVSQISEFWYMLQHYGLSQSTLTAVYDKTYRDVVVTRKERWPNPKKKLRLNQHKLASGSNQNEYDIHIKWQERAGR